MFSKSCEHGIRAVLFIAKESQKDRRPNIGEIAKAIDAPIPFTAKICQTLVKFDILLSRKGPRGGFYLEKDSPVRLIEIVLAIDGDGIFTRCSLGMQQCSSAHPCPVHDQFQHVRSRLRKMCEDTKIVDLAEKLQDGEAFLKV